MAAKLQKLSDQKIRANLPPRKFIPAILTDLEAVIDLQNKFKSNPEVLSLAEQVEEDTREQFRIECMRRFYLAELVLTKEIPSIEAYRIPPGWMFDANRKAVRMLGWIKADENRKWALDLIRNFTWPVLLICLHSDTFLDTFLHTGLADESDAKFDEKYDEKYAALKEHRSTIEFFARTRNFEAVRRTPQMTEYYSSLRDLGRMKRNVPLPFTRTLSNADWNRYNRHTKCTIHGLPAVSTPINHPHEWRMRINKRPSAKRLTWKIRRQGASHWELVHQENINTCILAPPHHFPDHATWPFPDPRYRTHHDGPCQACDATGTGTGDSWRADCACTMTDLLRTWTASGKYTGCRIDLVNYGAMGTGARALQDIKQGSLLGEYVGEVLPNIQGNHYRDGTYVYQDVRKTGPGYKNAEDSCVIDPIVHGNWTRYMNHSCSGHASFRGVAVGPLVLTVVVNNSRAIKFGEQILIHYGRDYFAGLQVCRCGADECELWGLEGENPEGLSLGEARERNQAPEWAFEEAKVDESREVEVAERVGRLEPYPKPLGRKKRMAEEEYYSPRLSKRQREAMQG